MTVVLTGATGLIGTAVLQALIESRHDVVAVVRSRQSADTVEKGGATAVIGDITDVAWLHTQFATADGAIHTASPGDASSADFDTAVVTAAVAAFAGTDKPYVHTSGAWVYGSGADITEDTPFDPPALTAWRAGVERDVLDADVRGVIVAPGVVYGAGQGLARLVTTPADDGHFRLIGDGAQHWTTVSADQIADLYVRAYANPHARGYYIGSNDDHPTVRELAHAAATVAGSGEVIAESPADSRNRLFAPLVDALLLDQIVTSTRARDELGWHPVGDSLVEAIRSGAYTAQR